ncbi:MAG: hypothetical protein ABI528_11560, partial [bacterium]
MNEEHTDTYFGTKVSDPYNWLEDMQSDKVIEWIKTENQITENYLNHIPLRKKMRETVTDVLNYERYSSPFKSGKYYFFYKNDGLQNQSVLYRQEGQDGNPEVFLDPNTLSDDGTVSIENTKVSWDEKYLAYSINRAGSDWEEIYIIDIETKEQLSDRLDWAKFSGIDWLDDGFYYNRYDEVLTDKLKEINLSSVKQTFHTAFPILAQSFLGLGAYFLFFTWIENQGEEQLSISNLIRNVYLILSIPTWGYSTGINTIVSLF